MKVKGNKALRLREVGRNSDGSSAGNDTDAESNDGEDHAGSSGDESVGSNAAAAASPTAARWLDSEHSWSMTGLRTIYRPSWTFKGPLSSLILILISPAAEPGDNSSAQTSAQRYDPYVGVLSLLSMIVKQVFCSASLFPPS